jgi:hypothetical protein
VSLYNIMMGVYPAWPALLAFLGLNRERVPRFRDCYVEDGYIKVLHRAGGNVRSYYTTEHAALKAIPEYVSETDWPQLDTTYGVYTFKVMKELQPLVDKALETYGPRDPLQLIERVCLMKGDPITDLHVRQSFDYFHKHVGVKLEELSAAGKNPIAILDSDHPWPKDISIPNPLDEG